jgi:N-glycosylase/DNA lyase
LYKEWSARDEKFKYKIECHPKTLNGIRVLRLNPVENLFSFICSSNNNIKRITQMVNNLCTHFGDQLGSIEKENFFQFPTITRLAQDDVEVKLRDLKFGYRAKYINKAAQYILKNYNDNNGEWLFSLRSKSYQQVTEELIKIPGIGRKVIPFL